MASTPGPSVRPSAWSRNARSTATMQSGSVRRSKTSRRDRIRTLGPPGRRGVEPLAERHALREHLVVIGRRREERTDGDVDPARLLVRILAVAQVRLVHEFAEAYQAAVAEARPLDQRLERAVLALVAQLHAGGIEGDGVL